MGWRLLRVAKEGHGNPLLTVGCWGLEYFQVPGGEFSGVTSEGVALEEGELDAGSKDGGF